jgi:hypothetical protein
VFFRPSLRDAGPLTHTEDVPNPKWPPSKFPREAVLAKEAVECGRQACPFRPRKGADP